MLSLGFIKNNMADKAVAHFRQIDQPDQVIMILLFSACAALGTDNALKLVKDALKKMPKSFLSNPRLLAALFDAFIKCGDCKSAELIFSKLPKTVISFGNLMDGFNREENFEKTFEIFEEFKRTQMKPNFVIYLTVLKALSKIGVMSMAESIIEDMPRSFLKNKMIQNALVDLWVRCYASSS